MSRTNAERTNHSTAHAFTAGTMSNKSVNTGMAPPARIKPRSRTATRKLTLMPVVVSVRGETLTVTLDPHSQHTLSWREEVAGLLPPGNCNLFSYPKVVAKPEHVLAITENQRKEQMARRVGIARAVIGAGICRGGRTIRLSKEGKDVAANDLDGGVATTEVVENDLDGDGFPDDPGYEVTAQAGLQRDDDSGSFSFKKGI